MTFVSNYSADAFNEWLEKQELTSIFKIIVNSSKISLDPDCEPYVPYDIPVYEDEAISQAPSLQTSEVDSATNEEIRKKTIEKLYHYYNFLLIEQSRERKMRDQGHLSPEQLTSVPKTTQNEDSDENPLLRVDEATSIALGYK